MQWVPNNICASSGDKEEMTCTVWPMYLQESGTSRTLTLPILPLKYLVCSSTILKVGQIIDKDEQGKI